MRMSEREPENNSLFEDDNPFQPMRRDEDIDEGAILNKVEEEAKVVATLTPSTYAVRMFEAEEPE